MPQQVFMMNLFIIVTIFYDDCQPTTTFLFFFSFRPTVNKINNTKHKHSNILRIQGRNKIGVSTFTFSWAKKCYFSRIFKGKHLLAQQPAKYLLYINIGKRGYFYFYF